jgi:hypothetical protein
MNFYSILHNPEKSTQDDEWIAVASNFSFQAFIFGVFWLMYNSMWRLSFLFISYGVIIGYLGNIQLFNDVQVLLLSLISALCIGFEAGDLMSNYLQKKGYILADIIYANSEDEALLKHYYKIAN